MAVEMAATMVAANTAGLEAAARVMEAMAVVMAVEAMVEGMAAEALVEAMVKAEKEMGKEVEVRVVGLTAVADVRAMVEAVRVGALEAAERADAKAAEAMAVVMVVAPRVVPRMAAAMAERTSVHRRARRRAPIRERKDALVHRRMTTVSSDLPHERLALGRRRREGHAKQLSARRAQQHEQILGTHRPSRARTRRGGRVRDRAVSGVVLECLLLPAVRCCQEATSLMYRADGAAAGTVVPYVSLAVAYP